MSPSLLLLAYGVAIVIASLAGGLVPIRFRLSHQRMELAIAFVAGLMIGLGVLDLLPHAMSARALAADIHLHDGATHEHDLQEALAPVGRWMLAGILAMFLVERLFCSHQHGGIGEAVTTHVDEATGEVHHEHGHSLTWTGALIGMTIHSVLAGIALAAAIESEVDALRQVPLLAGVGIFLMIVLHKPFDALSVGTLMASGEHRLGLRHLVNALFALATPAGMLLFHVGLRQDVVERSLVVSDAIAFSAGMFICIALSDLLSELRFHQRGRTRLIVGLLLGLALAWGIANLHGLVH